MEAIGGDGRQAVMDAAAAAVRSLIGDPVALLSGRELVDMVAAFEDVGRLVDAYRCLLAGEVAARSVDADSLARRHGQAKPGTLVARLARISDAAAADRVKVGSAIRPRNTLPGDIAPSTALPAEREHLADAMTSGTVGVESALAIERCLTEASRAASVSELASCEEELVGTAGVEATRMVAMVARTWRDWLDPDGIEPRADDIHDRRGITLGREHHGLTPVRGNLEPEFAALIRASFAESLSPDAKPRFLPEQDCLDHPALGLTTSPDGGENITAPMRRAMDPRSREQKQHDILHGLVTAGIRSTGTGPGEMRALTTVLATITVDELKNGAFAAHPGTGRLDQVEETIPAHLIGQAVCDAGLRLVTMDTIGGMLDEGRRYRLFTDRQRRVIALRDGGCAVPGCTAPASWCEIHHILFWLADDGATDIDNGVLLCPAHHRDVHRGLFTIRTIDHTPHLIPPPWVDPTRTPVPMGHPLGRPRTKLPPKKRRPRMSDWLNSPPDIGAPLRT